MKCVCGIMVTPEGGVLCRILQLTSTIILEIDYLLKCTQASVVAERNILVDTGSCYEYGRHHMYKVCIYEGL